MHALGMLGVELWLMDVEFWLILAGKLWSMRAFPSALHGMHLGLPLCHKIPVSFHHM